MRDHAILVGAVTYDPKVVTIWQGVRQYFHEQGVAMDFALFSSYERQVESLLRGHIDIAWNTPWAHVHVQQRTKGDSISLCMRDSDRDCRSKILVRRDAGIKDVSDLAGRTLAVGSRDSTGARILPLYFLKQAGVDLRQVELLPFDTDVGKHGDTGRSELEVLVSLYESRADAGVVGDLIWKQEQTAGRVDMSRISILWTTPPFDHCIFDAIPELWPEKPGTYESMLKSFQRTLYAMSWDNPHHRQILELQGLKKWVPPREDGYESLRAALKEQAAHWGA